MTDAGREATGRGAGTEAPIALFLPSLDGGGAERVVLRVANELAGRGVPVDLVLAEATGDYIHDVQPAVRVVDLESQRLLMALPGLVRYLRRVRPRALLASIAHTNVIAVLARALAGTDTRIVLREANTVSKIRAHAGRLRERAVAWAMPWAYPRADHIIAVSNGVATDLQEALGIGTDEVTTIYNPTDVVELRNRAEETVGHPWLEDGADGPPVLLGIGRLSEQKDFGTLLRAFREVRDHRPARLIILGKGPRREALADLARRLGVADAVSMPGFVDNPYAFIRRADLFVLSSAWEGMPNALIEAFVLGAPIVSTDCPSGPSEILEGGRWGRLVPVGDVEAMGQATRKALDEPVGSAEEAIEERTTDRFDIEDVGTQYLTLLTGTGTPTE
ncbi:glycosyltransferase [Salinibacter ruber]|uniref:glycosyltransferase n=1 Tax=Salinibacter ruber TaxID=146919 RepID=UPI0020735834|nr:glycosyltransferase [Salinibacter ruber]